VGKTGAGPLGKDYDSPCRTKTASKSLAGKILGKGRPTAKKDGKSHQNAGRIITGRNSHQAWSRLRGKRGEGAVQHRHRERRNLPLLSRRQRAKKSDTIRVVVEKGGSVPGQDMKNIR